MIRSWLLTAFAGLLLFGCAPVVSDTSDTADTAMPASERPATAAFDAIGLEKTASNGFTYPLSSLTGWTDGNYGACGSYYFTGKCHTGNDMVIARGTTVYSLAAGKILSQSGTQDSSCSSGWGYDYWSSDGTGTKKCNMALAIQYYDDDGTPFVVVVGHLIYATTYRSGTGAVPASTATVSPGTALGQVAHWATTAGSAISSDHVHFGVFPGTSAPTSWGSVSCSTSQAASTSLPSGCSSGGATAPGTYMGASGRKWVAPPDAPTLSSPASGGSASSPVTLKWTNGSGTYRSHVMVCTNSSLTSGCFNPDGAMTGAEPSALSTSYSASLSSGTYYWAVRGLAYQDYGGWGSYSSVRSFTVR